MKKLMSINYSDGAFNFSLLLIRLMFGISMIVNHGLFKIQNFSSLDGKFFDPFHIGSRWSLLMVIFAEVFCSFFIIIGLFTRIAVIPLIVAMAVAAFMANHSFSDRELSLLYLVVFSGILLVGPGKISADGLMK